MQTLQQLISGELIGSKKVQISDGLKEFPREILELSETLEILDLSGNNLSELPDDFGRLKKLKVAFFSVNNFTVFPKVLAECPSLTMIGFKSNNISIFPENSLPLNTQWLILTDNKIEELPKSIGDCTRLQKVAFAGNKLKELPIEMSKCVNLELLRISANNLTTIPSWLLQLPRLSWLAFSGNPCSFRMDNTTISDKISWENIELLEQLGEGASGIISKAIWKTEEKKEVAVKIFKGEVTSDGFPEDELATCIATGSHSNLVPLLGEIEGHSDNKKGIVMELISSDFSNLGNPPSFETCTRDVFSDNCTFSIHQVLTIASNVSSAANHLHEKGIIHGDLYAHNTMVDASGNALLGDFGAATCYDKNSEMAHLLEKLDVRAFGCLLEDLLERVEGVDFGNTVLSSLHLVKKECMNKKVVERPGFSSVNEELGRLREVFVLG